MRALFLALLASLLSACTQLFFQPDRFLVHTPDTFGAAYEPVEMRAADGTALFGWFLPSEGPPRATVLFLHGNGQNISSHIASVAWMPRAGFNVLALDYRGYGRSGGFPSLPGLQLDIDAAMNALLARADVDPQRVVLFGQSLGGALAIYYVTHSKHRNNVCALVADSAFSDYRAISREKFANAFITWPFQWLPWLTVDNRYSPEASVRAVSPIPLLLIHGDEDDLVPLHHSQRLYELAANPKELWVVQDSGHIQSMQDASLRERLTAYLDKACVTGPLPTTAGTLAPAYRAQETHSAKRTAATR
jgi:fermentation-respiration switch protein FrsA (DUF1100 family)